MLLYGIRRHSPWDLLAWALKTEYGLLLPAVQRAPNGKPFFPSLPRLHFSLSHSGELSLCALSHRPVGADIELLRPRRDTLPPYALTSREYARYRALGGDWPAFYTLWTRREAWCKYTGEGLALLWGRDAPEDLFFGSYGGEGWRAAVCGEEAPPDDIIWMEELP